MAVESSVTVTPSILKTSLSNLIKIGNVTPFIWGGPGIGKSSIVKQIASEHGFDNFVDIRLSMMDPVSLLGAMVPNLEKGTSSWLPPSFFKNEGRTLYFFDELNSAPPSIQAAAYQIILDRRIGPHALKSEDVVVAAGNTSNDRGVVYKMPLPLANRFIHFLIKPDIDDFIDYALKSSFHKHVVGYLVYQKGDLYNPDFTSPDTRGFPTPRSWEFVSKICYMADESGLSDKDIIPLICGSVGDGVGFKFVNYRKVAESVANIDDILSGKITSMEIKNVDIAYAVVIGLCYSLKKLYEDSNSEKISKKEFDAASERFIKFITNNGFQPEMAVMAVRFVLSTLNIDVDINLPEWDKFFENPKYMRGVTEAFTKLNKKVKK